ncbi:hypothetical protein [Paraburkholderia strydomiana]|uniref:hypothetical protein n=1 Tax=Paraburkholderia strydomiana TaxID=1245417 RepID=UPI0038B840BD
MLTARPTAKSAYRHPVATATSGGKNTEIRHDVSARTYPASSHMNFAFLKLRKHPQHSYVDAKRQNGKPNRCGAERVASNQESANDIGGDADAQKH